MFIRPLTRKSLLSALTASFGALFLFAAAAPRPVECFGQMDLIIPFGWMNFRCNNEGQECENDQGTCTEVEIGSYGTSMCLCGGDGGGFDETVNCNMWYDGIAKHPECLTMVDCPPKEIDGQQVEQECKRVRNIIFYTWYQCACRPIQSGD